MQFIFYFSLQFTLNSSLSRAINNTDFVVVRDQSYISPDEISSIIWFKIGRVENEEYDEAMKACKINFW